MKKIILCLLLVYGMKAISQHEFIGSTSFGRIVDISYHPSIQNKLFAATLGNHIVTSDDNGNTWNLFYTFPNKNVSIQKLKFYDNNSLVFCVDAGFGNWNQIFRLNINTASIVDTYTIPIPENSDESEITSFDIMNSNPDILVVQQYYGFFGSRFGKVYYSSNHGNNWNEIYHTVDFDAIFPNYVAISPSNPSKIFMSRIGGNDSTDWGGLFISEDSGQTWVEKLSGIDFDKIAFKPDNSNEILLGTTLGSLVQNLYRSTDGGENWEVVDTDWSNQMADGIFSIKYDPTNYNRILVFGLSEIIKTDDNFLTKEVFQFPNVISNPNNYFFGSNASINPFQTNQLFITNNDYPLFSNNFGQTVTRVNNKFFHAIGNSYLFQNQTEKNLYYSVQNGFVHHNLINQTSSAYNILPLQVFPNFKTTHFFDEHIPGRTYTFSSSFFGAGLAISNDNGATNIAFPLSYLSLNSGAADISNSNIIWASLSNDLLSSELLKIDISSPENIVTENITLPASGFISDIFIDSIDSNKKIIPVGNKILSTNDNGNNWTVNSTGLEIVDNSQDRIYKIINNPLNTNQFTIATSKGVFTSVDNTLTWAQLNDFYCHDVYHSTLSNDFLVAITYDTAETIFSVRYSLNSGQDWTILNDNLLDSLTTISLSVEFIDNNIVFYIATFDLGMLKYTIDINSLNSPEFKNSSKVIVYPNPGKDYIYIKTNGFDNIDSYAIFSIDGKKIIENKYHAGTPININNLNVGTYILRVISNTEEQSFKFIKN